MLKKIERDSVGPVVIMKFRVPLVVSRRDDQQLDYSDPFYSSPFTSTTSHLVQIRHNLLSNPVGPTKYLS